MKRRDFLGAAVVGAVAPALPGRVGASEPAPSPWLDEASREVTEEQVQVAAQVHYLGFDTFGTVVDWRGSVIEEVKELARRKGWSHVDPVQFAEDWRANYGPSRNLVRTGQLPWTDLDGLHRMTLDDLLVRYEITGLTEDEKVHLNKVWHRLHPWRSRRCPTATSRS
jgi:hypothetical protein